MDLLEKAQVYINAFIWIVFAVYVVVALTMIGYFIQVYKEEFISLKSRLDKLFVKENKDDERKEISN